MRRTSRALQFRYLERSIPGARFLNQKATPFHTYGLPHDVKRTAHDQVKPFLYNVSMSDAKTVRLTATVKAAG